MNPRQLLLLLLLLSALPARAEWGRLFYTPAERMEFDRTATSGTHRFDGEIRSSNGRTLRWIDGQTSTSPPLPQVKPGERWDARTGKPYPIELKPAVP